MSLQVAAGLLTCPICSGLLALDASAGRCSAGHSFDVGRAGYLNLLRGPPPAHADTPAMVAARERFLALGHYGPIAEAVTAHTAAASEILEVGAGTGWYLARCLDAAPGAIGVATDVSVPAARRAARAHPRLASVVANTWAGLPLADGAVSAVLCVFAPRNPAEFARVLRAGGVLVVVTPNPGHLAGLRAAHDLLDIEEDKAGRLARTLADGFAHVAADRVRATFHASPAETLDLIAMGPNAFHHVPREVVGGELELDVTLHAYVRG